MGVNRDMRTVLIKGPILSRSGYGEHVRLVYRALNSRPDLYDIYIEPTVWGTTSWSFSGTEDTEDILRCVKKSEHFRGKYNLSLQVMIPNEWQPIAEKNIGITAGIETDKASASWVHACNQVDKVIVVSNHAKEVFEKSKHIVDDPNNPAAPPLQIELSNEKQIEVIGYPVKTITPKTIDLDIKTEFNFLTVAQAGPRKCLDATIRWFVEEFKDDENVGLIVKSNLTKNCIMDRRQLTHQLNVWLAPYSDRKCKVYLLHGAMTEEELHYLYTMDSTKAYVTTTHGEGYGLPIFEAAYSGLPVLAPAWSGHVDFLYKKYEKKNKKKDKKPLFSKVKYTLQKVQEHVHWENIIIPEAKWAFSDQKSFMKGLRNIYETHSHKKKLALELKEYLEEEFSKEKIYNKYIEAVNSVYPPEVFEVSEWLKELENNIEVHE